MTRQIKISVQTQYVEEQSAPQADRYVFAYTIDIKNCGNSASQLLRRHWIITDGAGDVEEVRGDGVVGEQPRLGAGDSFRYSSGAVLKTPVGTMQGSYEFVDAEERTFEVDIPVFTLSVPHMVH